jgi:site-specific DNA-adenine methylase
MGSKARYSKFIVPILQKVIDENNITTYIECFVGGCNIIDKIQCENKFGYDRSDTLIALLQAAQTGMQNVLADGNRELWDKGKGYVKDGVMPEDMTLAEIGAMEFFASYCNGGFPRGYAKNTETRNYFAEARRNLEAQAPNLEGIIFKCQEYQDLEPVSGAVIYLDPPYQNTKTYGYANQKQMDYTHFWDWVRELSKDNYVFISEQSAPDDFEVVWEQEVTRTTNKENNFKAVEKLFKYKGE